MCVVLLVKDMQFRSINRFVLSRFLEALRYGKAPCSAEIAYLNNSLNSADGLKLLMQVCILIVGSRCSKEQVKMSTEYNCAS